MGKSTLRAAPCKATLRNWPSSWRNSGGLLLEGFVPMLNENELAGAIAIYRQAFRR